MLDISGIERLYKWRYGGEKNLARAIFNKMRMNGISISLACGPTVGCAWALAAFSGKPFSAVDHAQMRPLLADFPIEALRLETETIQELRKLGIENIAALQKLPRHELAQRFGVAIIKRLDQLWGASEEALLMIHPRTPLHIRKRFETPLMQQESVAKAIHFLFSKLLKCLEDRALSARSFLFRFEIINSDNSVSSQDNKLALHAASRNLVYLETVITPVIESLRAARGVQAISILACDTERMLHEQSDYIIADKQHTARQTKELLNHFAVFLGKGRVREVRFEYSYMPERSFSFPIIDTTPPPTHPTPLIVMEERPAYLITPPQPLKAIAALPDKAPAQITWQGRRHKILRGIGPERIALEWWQDSTHSDQAARDYFRVQDETGRWLWIFRDSTGEWFLHGAWL